MNQITIAHLCLDRERIAPELVGLSLADVAALLRISSYRKYALNCWANDVYYKALDLPFIVDGLEVVKTSAICIADFFNHPEMREDLYTPATRVGGLVIPYIAGNHDAHCGFLCGNGNEWYPIRTNARLKVTDTTESMQGLYVLNPSPSAELAAKYLEWVRARKSA